MDAGRDPVFAAAFGLHPDLTGQITNEADMLPTKLDLCSKIYQARIPTYKAVVACTRSPDELRPTRPRLSPLLQRRQSVLRTLQSKAMVPVGTKHFAQLILKVAAGR